MVGAMMPGLAAARSARARAVAPVPGERRRGCGEGGGNLLLSPEWQG